MQILLTMLKSLMRACRTRVQQEAHQACCCYRTAERCQSLLSVEARRFGGDISCRARRAGFTANLQEHYMRGSAV